MPSGFPRELDYLNWQINLRLAALRRAGLTPLTTEWPSSSHVIGAKKI
jgi:hypothetical protein